jgi:Flp pilus assembly pilin Flp
MLRRTFHMTLARALRRFVRQTKGVDLVEYALLGAFVAIAAYGGVKALGESLGGFYSGVVDSVVTQSMTTGASDGGAGGGGTGGGGTGGGGTGGCSGGGGTGGGGARGGRYWRRW